METRWPRRRGEAGRGAPGRAWRIGILAAALALAACESPAEPGGEGTYDFTLPVDDEVVYRWPAGSTVRVYVHGSGHGARNGLLEEAVARAARDWTAPLGPAAVRFARVAEPTEAEVVVRWSDTPPPVDTGACEPVVTGRAATTFCPTPDYATLERFPLLPPHEAEESLVRMVVTILADEAIGPRRVRQLVAHELGHVLGIGRHSPDPDDLMWDGPLGPIRPSAADRLTLQRLYRTPPTLVP